MESVEPPPLAQQVPAAAPPADPLEIVVIGGGAAGFFAAITCAEANPSARVTILEKSERFLAKVLISGGGRCNVTHACFDPAALSQRYPRGSRELLGPFHRFQPRDTVQWFESRGVPLKTEADGRIFPTSDRSQSIADALLRAARDAGVILRTRAGVGLLEREPPPPVGRAGFALELLSGERLRADRVLVATGSAPIGHTWARALGLTVEPPVPSLFTFEIRDPRLEGLAGISVPSARVTLPTLKRSEVGPLLITHWGLSGPAVLRLSAWEARSLHDADYRLPLEVCWDSAWSDERLRVLLVEARREWGRRHILRAGLAGIPQRLWTRLAHTAGVGEDTHWAELTRAEAHALVQALAHARLEIVGKGAFKEEFVTCGGIGLRELQLKNLETRRIPGLFFAGEAVDIDGLTGGFNFQAAWTTGYLAGLALAAPRASAAAEENPAGERTHY